MNTRQCADSGTSISVDKLSTCEACGATFACGAAQANCPCGELKLNETTLAQLSARYESCLCRACLEGFAAAEDNGDALQSSPQRRRD